MMSYIPSNIKIATKHAAINDYVSIELYRLQSRLWWTHFRYQQEYYKSAAYVVSIVNKCNDL